MRGLSVLVPLLLVACSSGSGGPGRVLPVDGEPAAPPDGTGMVAIDMAGEWAITVTRIDEWSTGLVAPLPDPTGWTFVVEEASPGRFELSEFGPFTNLDPQTMVGVPHELNWSRNEGDGRFLIYGASGMLDVGSNTVWPQFVNLIPVMVHAIGIGIGSVDPMAMAGHFEQIGPTRSDRISFEFTATRSL